LYFFFQAEDGIRDGHVTGVQTCALPIFTSFAYFAYSLRISAANSSGAVIQGSTPPALVSLSLISGSASALFTSVRRRASTGSGVPAGANKPYHWTMTKSG